MKLVRLLLVTLCAAAGLVVLTQVPAMACSCVAATTAEHVEWADVVFVGTLTEIEQTDPGDDGTISSGDPVFYTFDVDETFKGDAGDAVVESVRDGASCGLEGMQVDGSYVVFAGEDESGALDANLCGGTSSATPQLIAQVEAAVAAPATPPASPTPSPTPSPAVTPNPTPVAPVPTQVPSGVETASPDDGMPTWAWLGGGALLVVAAGAAVLLPRWR